MNETGPYCRYCGAKIEPNSKFCSNCGKPTSLAPSQPATGSTNSGRIRKKRSKKKVAGIVILSIIGIFGGLLALGSLIESMNGSDLNRSSNNSSMTTSRPQPQPAANPLSDSQALVNEVDAYMSQQGWQYPQQNGDMNMTRVATGIVVSKYLENSAVVVVVPSEIGTCWSGSVMGSDNVQTTRDGCNTGYFSIPCSGFFGSYSLAIQRSDESSGGEFLVQVWKEGEPLKEASTQASYGVVSFAGGCSVG